MSVFVEVYDSTGKLLSRSTSIDVPVVRSKLTTVKAEFPTAQPLLFTVPLMVGMLLDIMEL